MSVIAVMDIGKTNAKLCLVDTDTGELVHTEKTQTRVIDAEPYPHLDTKSVWLWYLSSLKRLRKTHKISTIVVTAHGATAALLDDDGLVLPVMDYEFSGLDEFRAEYDAICDPFEQTFSPKLPLGLNLGRQLYWQRKRCPDRYARARSLVPYAQYWSWLLTGVAVAEVSTIGSHSDLWNPGQKRYSDFAQREGFANLFPPLAYAADVLGPPTDEVQAATGIDKTCQVLVGIHDSNASLIPWISSRSYPFTVMSTGTWVIIFALGSPLDGMLAERDCTANVTIHSEPVACARFMGGREYASIAGDTPAVATEADLLQIIDKQVFALPAFAETGGPYSGCTGVVQTDTALTAAQKHALAAVYCALVSDESLTLCNSAGDIIVEGSFAKNSLLLQCLAVFRGKQAVYASADSTGTTMGAAMLQTGVVGANDSRKVTRPAAHKITTAINAPQLVPATVSDTYMCNKLLEYRSRWHQQVEKHQRQVRNLVQNPTLQMSQQSSSQQSLVQEQSGAGEKSV